MNELPRETLRSIVAKHGEEVFTDSRKCGNLLNDLCGRHPREINVLVAALQERVPLDLLAGARSLPKELLLSQLEKRLEEQTAMTAEAARWAVESWALALSIITEDDIRSRQTHHRPPAVPRSSAPGTTAIKEPARQPGPPINRRPHVSGPSRQSAAPAQPRGSSNKPYATQTSVPGPLQPPRAPSSRLPKSSNTLPQANTSFAGRGFRLIRGCLVAIILLVIFSAVVFLGVPYAIHVMRETQREENAKPPRFPVR